MTTANVVFSGPASNTAPIRREAKATAASLPGTLVELDASGDFQAHSIAGGGGDLYILDMDTIRQKSVTEAVTVGDDVRAFVPEVGCTYNVILADGETIVKGDMLASGGDGTVVEATATGATPDVVLFVAEEALSPSGANGRLRVRYVASGVPATA